MFTKFLNWPVFIGSFVVGIIFVQLAAPTKTVVYVYPTPENIEHIEYVDKADNCFQYKSTPVSCPKDLEKIRNIPVQMGNTKRKIDPNQVAIGATEVN